MTGAAVAPAAVAAVDSSAVAVAAEVPAGLAVEVLADSAAVTPVEVLADLVAVPVAAAEDSPAAVAVDDVNAS